MNNLTWNILHHSMKLENGLESFVAHLFWSDLKFHPVFVMFDTVLTAMIGLFQCTLKDEQHDKQYIRDKEHERGHKTRCCEGVNPKSKSSLWKERSYSSQKWNSSQDTVLKSSIAHGACLECLKSKVKHCSNQLPAELSARDDSFKNELNRNRRRTFVAKMPFVDKIYIALT